MPKTATVTLERRIAAPPEMVFDAWLDPAGVGAWLFATPAGTIERIEIDPRVGGRFRIDERRDGELTEHHGEYVALDRPHGPPSISGRTSARSGPGSRSGLRRTATVRC